MPLSPALAELAAYPFVRQDEAKAAVDVPMWREWTKQPKMNETHILHVYQELKR